MEKIEEKKKSKILKYNSQILPLQKVLHGAERGGRGVIEPEHFYMRTAYAFGTKVKIFPHVF